MHDPDVKNAERRRFFKWTLLGTAALASAVGGAGSSLLSKEKDSMVSVLEDSAEVITDAAQGSHHRLKTSQDFRLANPVNAKDGQRIVWEIIQDEVGGRKMSLDNKFVFGTDLTKVELTPAAQKRDFLTAIYNQSVDKWHVVAFIRGY